MPISLTPEDTEKVPEGHSRLQMRDGETLAWEGDSTVQPESGSGWRGVCSLGSATVAKALLWASVCLSVKQKAVTSGASTLFPQMLCDQAAGMGLERGFSVYLLAPCFPIQGTMVSEVSVDCVGRIAVVINHSQTSVYFTSQPCHTQRELWGSLAPGRCSRTLKSSSSRSSE